MIIFNTTYCMEYSAHDRCLVWLREKYIPRALQSGQMHSPRMSKILSQDTDGINYSLQFRVESVEMLEAWYIEVGDQLQQELSNHFGESVLGFSTLMEEVEI
jgi:hypothetical protein